MGRRKMDSDLYRIKLETGTVYQTSKGGNYYFRYQINGERKCVSLKTANQEEALRKAKALLPTVQATELEVIASHVKVARKLAAKVKTLPLSQVWEVYSQHPQRAVPSTVREHLLYKSTLEDFIRFVGKSATNFAQISETHTMAFADHLRTLQISVSTHNRKIIRLRKIFTTLQSKCGNKLLRRLLVQGAQYIMGPFGEDSDLKDFGTRISQRGGSIARKKAKVAVARKLAVTMLALWRNPEIQYDPHFKKNRKKQCA